MVSFAQRAKFTATSWLAGLMLLGLQGCGGGGGNPALPAPAAPAPLVALQAEPVGANCALGGRSVRSGIDADRNGTLASGEVANTQYLCDVVNAAPGTSGVGGRLLLVATVTEAAGSHCSAGGTKVSVGIDTNGNAVLDSTEVTSTAYVCGEGRSSIDLRAVSVEPIGSHCSNGGSKIAAGVDTNHNGILDTGEVSATSYSCDAAPTSGFTWLSEATSGTTMQGDTGYLATGTSQVTLSLPASPNVGEVFRVNGVGAGGWLIEQQAGQMIVPAHDWSAHESSRLWRGVASSQDGLKLVAVVNNGQIYTSTDAGLNWTARDAARVWWGVASSADGVKLVAVTFGGQIYTSADSGVTWTARASNRSWSSVSTSSDGSKLAATVYGGAIYTSSDSGVTWTARASTQNWTSVASSADGTKLAATAYQGQIYTSLDAGLNWTATETTRDWYTIASSSDGDMLVAAVQNGQLFTSTDAGASWTPRESTRNWSGLASSADGLWLAASDMSGELYLSSDAGVTWTATGSTHPWNAIASSSDGHRLVGVEYNGLIYTSLSSTSSGTGGAVSGSQGAAIELVYLGGGVFEVEREVGALDLN